MADKTFKYVLFVTETYGFGSTRAGRITLG